MVCTAASAGVMTMAAWPGATSAPGSAPLLPLLPLLALSGVGSLLGWAFMLRDDAARRSARRFCRRLETLSSAADVSARMAASSGSSVRAVLDTGLCARRVVAGGLGGGEEDRAAGGGGARGELVAGSDCDS